MTTSRILTQPPVRYTVTISPMADGTANIETRFTPPDQTTVDAIMLCQTLIGIVAETLLAIQDHRRMVLGLTNPQHTDDGGKTE